MAENKVRADALLACYPLVSKRPSSSTKKKKKKEKKKERKKEKKISSKPAFMLRPQTVRLAASVMSASRSMKTGFFPPSSRMPAAVEKGDR